MLAKSFFSLLFLLLAIAVTGCAVQSPTPVITASPPVNIERVMVVPQRVVESCQPLPVLADGSKNGVLNWAIDANGAHGVCMFRKDLSDDFLRAAAESRATVELYQPPSTVVSTDGPTDLKDQETKQ